MSVNITHNNNGRHYRIAIDIAKEGSEIFDLTPYFKGRVGDNRFGLEIVWYYQGQLLDCTGMKPIIQGNVGNFSLDEKKNVQMAPDASVVAYTGDPNDCQSNGKAIYHFPEQMFPKEGVFSGFIGLIDDSDEGGKAHYSGVNIWFRVLGGIAQMGKAAAFYVSDLETAIQNGKEKLREALTDYEAQFKAIMDSLKKMGDDAKKDFTDWLANFKQTLTDAMAEINDPKDGLYVRYNQLLDMTKQIQETLKQAQFHDRPFQLKTVAAMKAYAPLIAGDIVITQGWDNYDDGHGAYWNIRVKHKDEVPDENNVISLDNGMVAERNSSLVSADSLEDFLYGYTIEIKHNQGEYPIPRVFYYEDAIGTEINGLGSASHGLGEVNVKYIPARAEYKDPNTILVKIPRNFYLNASPNYDQGAWYLGDENRTLKVDLGFVDDEKAKETNGQGSSYLSAGSGYFSKPTSPTDLRAVYIDEHTQRLLWRGV